jgi:hypothetical protein
VPASRGLRLLDTLLLAAVTTKPAMGVAGFGAGLGQGVLGPQSDGLSVPERALSQPALGSTVGEVGARHPRCEG